MTRSAAALERAADDQSRDHVDDHGGGGGGEVAAWPQVLLPSTGQTPKSPKGKQVQTPTQRQHFELLPEALHLIQEPPLWQPHS